MKYSCKDRMCGALDCNLCYPGNAENCEPCETCDAEPEDCDCADYDPREDWDD